MVGQHSSLVGARPSIVGGGCMIGCLKEDVEVESPKLQRKTRSRNIYVTLIRSRQGMQVITRLWIWTKAVVNNALQCLHNRETAPRSH